MNESHRKISKKYVRKTMSTTRCVCVRVRMRMTEIKIVEETKAVS